MPLFKNWIFSWTHWKVDYPATRRVIEFLLGLGNTFGRPSQTVCSVAIFWVQTRWKVWLIFDLRYLKCKVFTAQKIETHQLKRSKHWASVATRSFRIDVFNALAAERRKWTKMWLCSWSFDTRWATIGWFGEEMVEPLKFDGFGELSEPLSCKRSNFDKLSKLSKDALKKIQFLPAKKQESHRNPIITIVVNSTRSHWRHWTPYI